MKISLVKSLKLSLAITANLTLLSFILTIVSIRSISIGSVFIENATAQSSSYREQRKKDADELFSLARKQSGVGGTYTDIEKKYRQALTIYKEIGEYQSEIRTLVRLAELDALRFRHGKAVEILRQAIQIAQLSGDRKIELEILLSNLKFGDLIEDRDIMKVLQYLILRDPLSISLNERFLYLISLDKSFFLQNPQYNYCIFNSYIGDAYFGKKLYPKAVEAYKMAVESYTNTLECPKREPRDLWFKNELLIKLGFTHKLIKQELQAQTALDEALGYFDGSVNKNTSIRVMSDGLFTNFITIAVAKNSDKLLQKVFRVHRDYFNNNFGDWNSISTIKHLGEVYELLGKYDLAITYYKQALDYTLYPQKLERYAQEGIKLIRSRILQKIARMHVILGNDSEALKSYLLALRELKSYRESQESWEWKKGAGLLIDIGNFYSRIGEVDKARNSYKEANEILDFISRIDLWGGPGGSVSILSDEDDLDKLLPSSSTDRKSEPINQEIQK